MMQELLTGKTRLVESGKPGAELDVFGGNLRDGHPCIWVNRNVSRQALADRLEETESFFGTHAWNESTFSACNLWDQTPESIRKFTKDDEDHWIMHQVEFFGRSKEGLTKELEKLLTEAKKLK